MKIIIARPGEYYHGSKQIIVTPLCDLLGMMGYYLTTKDLIGSCSTDTQLFIEYEVPLDGRRVRTYISSDPSIHENHYRTTGNNMDNA